MPYERGPFHLQPNSALLFQPGVYNLSDLVTVELAPMDVALGDINLLATAMEAETIFDTIDPLDDADLDGAVIEFVGQMLYGLIPDMDIMIDAVSEADGLLDGAVSAAPAEAWSDPPAPFRLPFDVGLLPTPGLDTGAYVPGTTPPPTGTTLPPLPNRAISLINATRYGSRNYTVTDTWLVQATGNPGDSVDVHAYVDGQDIGTESIGQIGSDGRFEHSGIFAPQDVGAWREDWSVGGQFMITYNFIVSAT